MQVLSDLLHTPAFYTALLALAQAVLFYFLPAFPREVWAAAALLIGVVAGVITGQSIEVKRQARIEAKNKSK